jgi:integrase
LKAKTAMEKPKNLNHPAKGSTIAVSPIRNMHDVKSIRKLLADNPRNLLLFVMGINNGLRVGDLLKLAVCQVNGLKVGGTLTIREGKTKKQNILVVNKGVHKALQNYLIAVKPEDDNYLFESRKGDKPLTIQSVNRLIKTWARAINLKGNYGAHTLRKTWGYHQRITFHVGFEILAKRFNHSSPAITMRYLGIEDKEVHSTLMNEIG